MRMISLITSLASLHQVGFAKILMHYLFFIDQIFRILCYSLPTFYNIVVTFNLVILSLEQIGEGGKGIYQKTRTSMMKFWNFPECQYHLWVIFFYNLLVTLPLLLQLGEGYAKYIKLYIHLQDYLVCALFIKLLGT